MAKILDAISDLQGSQAGTTQARAPSGRVRRPTEKVQAMQEEEHEEEKTARQQGAVAKAKKREQRTRKRDQAVKAAQQDPLKTGPAQAQLGTTTDVPAVVDNSFASRAAGGHGPTTTRGDLATQASLVARKGNIPPTAGKASTNTDANGQLPPRVHFLIGPVQSIKNDALRLNDTTTATDATTRKRVREREPTPFPTQDKQSVATPMAATQHVWQDERTNPNSDKHGQGDYDRANGEHDDPSVQQPPRKRIRRVIQSDNDEPKVGLTQTVATEEQPVVADGGRPQADPVNLKLTAGSEVPSKPAALSCDKKTKTSTKSRPKAGDYDAATRHILDTAIELYHVLLLTESPFPAPHVELEWARGAWDLSCRYYKTPNAVHDAAIIKLITARESNLRGQFKTKARPITVTMFGFETGESTAVREKNRNLVTELKTGSAFTYRDFRPRRSGIYRSRAAQQVINEVLFKNKTDEGIKWAEYYQPFPHVAYALTLTALECAIDEWTTGARESIAFKEEVYAPVYRCHLNSLEYFQQKTHKMYILPSIMNQVYDNGRSHAGVRVAPPGNSTVIPDDAIQDAIEEFSKDVEDDEDEIEADEYETDEQEGVEEDRGDRGNRGDREDVDSEEEDGEETD